MKEKKIFIQMGVTVDLGNEDLEDFLAYLPEKFTGFVTNEAVIMEDELYDEDIKILDEKGKIISVDDIVTGVEEVKEVEEEDEGKTEDTKSIKVELKNVNDDPLYGSHCGFRESNGMMELSGVLPKDEHNPNNERKCTYLIPPANILYIEIMKPIL